MTDKGDRPETLGAQENAPRRRLAKRPLAVLTELVKAAKYRNFQRGEDALAAIYAADPEKAKNVIDFYLNWIDRFLDSAEWKAREALCVRLKELRHDSAIKQSEMCLDLLEALILCLGSSVFAKNSGELLHELRPYFDKSKAQKAASAKLAADPKQLAKASARAYWNRWQEQPTLYASKAEFARDMLEKSKGALDSADVIARWCRLWEKERTPR